MFNSVLIDTYIYFWETCSPPLFVLSYCGVYQGWSTGTSVSGTWRCIIYATLFLMLRYFRMSIFFPLLFHGIIKICLKHLHSKAPISIFSDCEMVHDSHRNTAAGKVHALTILIIICLLTLCHRLSVGIASPLLWSVSVWLLVNCLHCY